MEFELKEVHLEYLKNIRRHRKTFMRKAFGGLMVIPVIILLIYFLNNGLPQDFSLSSLVSHYFGFFLYLLIFLVLGGIPMLIVFLVRILPLNKDIRKRSGAQLKRQIIRKQFFPITNEYFLFFREEDFEHIKVNPLSYDHYTIGDYFTIGRSKYAKIFFDDYKQFDFV